MFCKTLLNHECLSKCCHGCQVSARLCALLWVPKKRLVTCWPYKPYVDYSPPYIVFEVYLCGYLCVCILCLFTTGTRPKYWSRFSGAQCQNGNNANFIIIILGVGLQKWSGCIVKVLRFANGLLWHT